MSHKVVVHLLSIILLVCIGVVLTIDALADYNVEVGLLLKWSLLWHACRYIGSICAAVLALDVLF